MTRITVPSGRASWVRWRAGGGWSIWHRVLATSQGLVETGVLDVSAPSVDVGFLEQTHITACGIVVYPDLISELTSWPDASAERCVTCLRAFLVSAASPPGWPGGGSIVRGGRMVLRADRRRRPLNQPAL